MSPIDSAVNLAGLVIQSFVVLTLAVAAFVALRWLGRMAWLAAGVAFLFLALLAGCPLKGVPYPWTEAGKRYYR